METNDEKSHKDEKNLFIIYLVQNYPCLYNKHLNVYKNNVKNNKAWQELAEQFREKFKENDVSGKFLNFKIIYKIILV